MCCDNHHIQPIDSCTGLICLLLNIFMPSFGSMVYACSVGHEHRGKAWGTAIVQFILMLVPLVNIGIYIWIIVYGCQINSKSSDHHK